ncbi:MAG: TatD family hydrolase [Bacilli bacterium]|nr:TatD family hydrolase [Bacilli bacterium]
MLIDSHVHINHDFFNGKENLYIQESKKSNINLFLCVGWDLKSSQKAVQLSKQFNEVFACVGIHPEEIKNMKEHDFEEIEKLIKNKKVIAIGEIGLDFFREKSDYFREKQKEYFVKFIQLANKYNLPVVIHSRNAYLEAYELLKKYNVQKKGVIHCCCLEDERLVDDFLKIGFFFGFGGVVTFKNSLGIKKCVAKIPLEKILLETDAPFLTPEPFRGHINHSKYLNYIVDAISSIKHKNFHEIENQTMNNFNNLFFYNANKFSRDFK